MARKRKPEEEFDDAEFFEFLDEEGEKDDMQWYAQFGASKIIDFRSIGRGAHVMAGFNLLTKVHDYTAHVTGGIRPASAPRRGIRFA